MSSTLNIAQVIVGESFRSCGKHLNFLLSSVSVLRSNPDLEKRGQDISYPHSLPVRESRTSRANKRRHNLHSLPFSKRVTFFITKGSCKWWSTKGTLRSSHFPLATASTQESPWKRGSRPFTWGFSWPTNIHWLQTGAKTLALVVETRVGTIHGFCPEESYNQTGDLKMCLTHHSKRRWKGKVPLGRGGHVNYYKNSEGEWPQVHSDANQSSRFACWLHSIEHVHVSLWGDFSSGQWPAKCCVLNCPSSQHSPSWSWWRKLNWTCF